MSHCLGKLFIFYYISTVSIYAAFLDPICVPYIIFGEWWRMSVQEKFLGNGWELVFGERGGSGAGKGEA